MNFIIGMITMYCIIGVIVLILNTLNVDEDIKDLIIGWWLIPLVIITQKIHRFFIKRKKKNKKSA